MLEFVAELFTSSQSWIVNSAEKIFSAKPVHFAVLCILFEMYCIKQCIQPGFCGTSTSAIQWFCWIESSSVLNSTCWAYSAPPNSLAGGKGVAAPLRKAACLRHRISGLVNAHEVCAHVFRWKAFHFKGKVEKRWSRICTKLCVVVIADCLLLIAVFVTAVWW